ncbi:Uu.00g111390.m01.CDS01 [Anthostomella pinea]|uniref:Uu.00g111390.m01.CDS01 n=1 Tax=Anthostomella pinea TaxID=933095 RepID=A0AAI8VFS1_9PEZI|nr:Uu.00g111390.m01.CDS01 [Anthostomella pinea]
MKGTHPGTRPGEQGGQSGDKEATLHSRGMKSRCSSYHAQLSNALSANDQKLLDGQAKLEAAKTNADNAYWTAEVDRIKAAREELDSTKLFLEQKARAYTVDDGFFELKPGVYTDLGVNVEPIPNQPKGTITVLQ